MARRRLPHRPSVSPRPQALLPHPRESVGSCGSQSGSLMTIKSRVPQGREGCATDKREIGSHFVLVERRSRPPSRPYGRHSPHRARRRPQDLVSPTPCFLRDLLLAQRLIPRRCSGNARWVENSGESARFSSADMFNPTSGRVSSENRERRPTSKRPGIGLPNPRSRVFNGAVEASQTTKATTGCPRKGPASVQAHGANACSTSPRPKA